jgi:hypothetical protein
VSYEIRVTAPHGLDLEPLLAAGAEEAGDELVWARETLIAQFLPGEHGVDVGVVGHEAPRERRADEFREVLEVLLAVASRAGGSVHDPQLGRDLGPADIAVAVDGFA